MKKSEEHGLFSYAGIITSGKLPHNTTQHTNQPVICPYTVLFCSLAILDLRVGHTMDVLSPFIPVHTLPPLNKARDDGVLGWQCHQLDHMQTICTSLQADDHTNISSLNIYRLDALPGTQPTVSKH